MSLMTHMSSVRFIEPALIYRIMKLFDFAVMLTAATIFFFASMGTAENYNIFVSILLALNVALATIFIWRGAHQYRINKWRKSLITIAVSTGWAVLISLISCGLANWFLFEFSFSHFIIWQMAIAGWLLVSRLMCAMWASPLISQGAFKKRIAIVGGGKAAEDAISLLEADHLGGLEIVGLFDDRNDERSPESIKRYAKIGKIEELADFSRNQRVELIVVAIPLSAEERLLQMLKRLWELPVDIRISGDSSKLKLSPQAYSYLGKLPLLSVFDRPLSPWGELSKAIMDRVLSAIFIVVFAPVMAATALAVKLESKGPAIFKQKRYGFNNELIEVYKFRSMYTDRCDASATKLVTKDDPRVTKVGRFIRKTSLDELPQLFNVLTGQLSLVGPRPHATQAKAAEELYEQVVDGYFARHKVKPGITGWAQVNGWRGETNTRDKIENRVKFDLEYIDNWSLWFDINILAQTPIALLRPGNAANAY